MCVSILLQTRSRNINIFFFKCIKLIFDYIRIDSRYLVLTGKKFKNYIFQFSEVLTGKKFQNYIFQLDVTLLFSI